VRVSLQGSAGMARLAHQEGGEAALVGRRVSVPCPGDLPSGQASVRGGNATGKCNPAPPGRSARRPSRGSGHAVPNGVWRRQDPTRATAGLYADLREFVHVHSTCGEMRATSCRASVGVHLGVFCSCGGRFDGWLSGMAATALHLYTVIPPD
jgi:hypothetical protein